MSIDLSALLSFNTKHRSKPSFHLKQFITEKGSIQILFPAEILFPGLCISRIAEIFFVLKTDQETENCSWETIAGKVLVCLERTESFSEAAAAVVRDCDCPFSLFLAVTFPGSRGRRVTQLA